MKENSTPKVKYAVEKIKEMLFSGEYEQGDKLPSETFFAAKIGVGRSCLREALRLLEASGYIEIIPNRGAFAVAISEDDVPSAKTWLEINADKVAELLDVRSCIEPFTAALCAQSITDEGLDELKRLLDDFEAAIDLKDWKLLAKYDLEFHRTILAQSHNQYLIQIYKPLLEGFMQYSHRSFAATYSQGNTLSEHRAIYNAIAAHSPDEARAAMQLHINIAKRRAVLNQQNLRGE